jgi:MFS family permease
MPVRHRYVWGIVAPLYGISLFLFTIVKGLGYKTTTAQLLTGPIYVFASAIAILFARFSDHGGKRTPFILPLMFVILIGSIMRISSSNPGVVYAGKQRHEQWKFGI